MKTLQRFFALSLSLVLSTSLLTSCNQFGKEVKIKKNSVYYKNVTESDAKKVGDFFYSIGYFNDNNEISVQLSKPKDTMQLRFVVDKEKVKPEMDEQYLFIVSTLSDSLFNGAPIEVFLADAEMKDLKRVGLSTPLATTQAAGETGGDDDVAALLQQTEDAAEALGKNVKEVKDNKLFYDDNVEKSKVDAVATYLADGGYFDSGSGHIAVLVKQGDGYIFKEAFTDEQINNKATTDALEDVATSIKQSLFNSQNFTFEVCDLKFQPKVKFTPLAK